MLTSLHEGAADKIDWQEIAHSPPPSTTSEDGLHVRKLNAQIENFQPTLRDKIFNRTEARIEKMKSQLPEAQEKDRIHYKEWQDEVHQAKQVLEGDRKAWKEVIHKTNPFKDLEDLGSTIDFYVEEKKNQAMLKMKVDKRVVSAKELSVTKTGKLSQKNMTKGKHFTLFQEYISSSVLRAGRELFSLLPLDTVVVHVYGLAEADEKNGCILSVFMYKNEMEELHFENIDCVETIKTFTHHMKFLKTKGFRLVEEVTEG
ncbi:hypothetical protein ACE1TI_00235 [Alteribacillus sp. JSM 102045]|uniref:hypothetical protein n=1 Tax=Alteribacillus sp. JSM 102045 TaxID=1562101 RepID=UPI0035BF9A77